MNRNVIIGVVLVLIIAVVVVLGYSFLSNNNNSTTDENITDDNIGSGTGKTLIVYYSATGNTEGVAERLAENLNADTFEIVPSDPYTDEDLDWTDDNSRVSREYNDESLRFVETNDFTGKTVIPFCTSSSSGLGQSGDLLEDIAGTGTWQEGHRFSSNPSDDDITDFIDSIS